MMVRRGIACVLVLWGGSLSALAAVTAPASSTTRSTDALEPLRSPQQIVESLPAGLRYIPGIGWDKYVVPQLQAWVKENLIGRRYEARATVKAVRILPEQDGRSRVTVYFNGVASASTFTINDVAYAGHVTLGFGQPPTEVATGLVDPAAAKAWEQRREGSPIALMGRISGATLTNGPRGGVVNLTLDFPDGLASAQDVPPDPPAGDNANRPLFRNLGDVVLHMPPAMRNMRAWDKFMLPRVQDWVDKNIVGQRMQLAFRVTRVEVTRSRLPAGDPYIVSLTIEAPAKGDFEFATLDNKFEFIYPATVKGFSRTPLATAYRFTCGETAAKAFEGRAPGYFAMVQATIGAMKITPITVPHRPPKAGAAPVLKGFEFDTRFTDLLGLDQLTRPGT